MTNVSVIIPVYNASLLIERCITSILNQRGNFDIEIITIDDGSTDVSVEKIKNLDSNIVILSQENQGPAAARNKGIERATGEYLAFLDADDYWRPRFLKQTVEFLEKNPEAIAVSVGQIHKIPGKKDSKMPQLKGEDRNIPKSGIILDDFFLFWATYNHVCTGSVLMRTEFVKQSGGQRTELRITEDLEFWAYLATFGKWGFVPELLLITDGGIVVKNNGYYKKNLIRWRNAPSIEQWESRILTKINKKELETYNYTIGRIAKMLMYSYLQSFRIRMAHKTVVNHANYFPQSKHNKLYSICGKVGFPAWGVLSLTLASRELIRSLRYLKLK